MGETRIFQVPVFFAKKRNNVAEAVERGGCQWGRDQGWVEEWWANQGNGPDGPWYQLGGMDLHPLQKTEIGLEKSPKNLFLGVISTQIYLCFHFHVSFPGGGRGVCQDTSKDMIEMVSRSEWMDFFGVHDIKAFVWTHDFFEGAFEHNPDQVHLNRTT